jgi:hypothetical protein
MFTTLKIQLQLIFEKVMATFAQPKQGVVVPVDEKVKTVMEAPYKLEPLVEIDTKLTVAKAPKKPAAKKPTAKKTPTKKAPVKKKAQ